MDWRATGTHGWFVAEESRRYIWFSCIWSVTRQEIGDLLCVKKIFCCLWIDRVSSYTVCTGIVCRIVVTNENTRARIRDIQIRLYFFRNIENCNIWEGTCNQSVIGLVNRLIGCFCCVCRLSYLSERSGCYVMCHGSGTMVNCMCVGRMELILCAKICHVQGCNGQEGSLSIQ